MSSRKLPDYSYVNENGILVSGSAAFVHHVYSECDGVSDYNDKVAKEYNKVLKMLPNELIKQISHIVNMNLTKNAKKRRFKRIV